MGGMRRLGSATTSKVTAWLNSRGVAELCEALGCAQPTLDGSFASRSEEGRAVHFSRLALGDVPEASAFAEPAVSVADRHHALPMAAFEGRREGLAPEHPGPGEVVSV